MIVPKSPPYVNTAVDPEKTKGQIAKLFRDFGITKGSVNLRPPSGRGTRRLTLTRHPSLASDSSPKSHIESSKKRGSHTSHTDLGDSERIHSTSPQICQFSDDNSEGSEGLP